jgi:hypothetical protein
MLRELLGDLLANALIWVTSVARTAISACVT